MKQQRVDTGWAWAKKLNIPAGAKLGDTVYLSGICSLDNAGNVVAKGDVYGQSKRTFANIEEALVSAGAAMAVGPKDWPVGAVCLGGRVVSPRLHHFVAHRTISSNKIARDLDMWLLGI